MSVFSSDQWFVVNTGLRKHSCVCFWFKCTVQHFQLIQLIFDPLKILSVMRSRKNFCLHLLVCCEPPFHLKQLGLRKYLSILGSIQPWGQSFFLLLLCFVLVGGFLYLQVSKKHFAVNYQRVEL
jgi:hypothetical protein